MANYFIGDFHFGHKNIIKFERIEFMSIEEHDAFIIAAINNVVTPLDTLYVLGDVGSLAPVAQINGRKILIKGNHDKRSDAAYLGYFAEVYNTPIYLNKRLVLSHEPIMVNTDVMNVHGHLHGARLASSNHICVSARNIEYRPITEQMLQIKLSRLPVQSTHFLEEWYADLYEFDLNRNDVVTDANGRVLLKQTLEYRKAAFSKEMDTDSYIVNCIKAE